MKLRSGRGVVVLSLSIGICLSIGAQTIYGKSPSDSADKRYKTALEILAGVPGITNFAATEFIGIRESNPELDTKEKIEARVKEGIKILDNILEEGYEPKGVYYILGAAYARLLDRERAIKYFEKSIEQEPERETTYVNLLFHLWDKNDSERAFALLENYKKTFRQKQYEYHFFRAATYQRAEDYQKAILEAEQAIKIKPNSAEARFALGAAYLYANDPEEADKQFSLAVEIDPEIQNQVISFKKSFESKKKKMS